MTFDFPEGWRLLTISELAGLGGVVADGDWIESKDQDPHGDVRLIQLADIGVGEFLNRSSRFLTSKKARELQCTMLQTDDLLIARMPDPLGRACLFPGVGQPSVTAVDVFIWRPGKNAADTRWLMHAINSPQVRAHLQNIAGGTTRQRVSGGNLKRLALPTPPKAMQRRLAAKIDSLSARSKTVREELEHIPKLVERYKQATLRAAFQGHLSADWRATYPAECRINLNELRQESRRASQVAVARMRSENTDFGELPTSWVAAPIGRVATLQPGYAFKSQWFSGEGVRLLRGTNIVPDDTRWDEVAYLPTTMVAEFEEYRLHSGDIVIAMDRPLVSAGLKVAQLTETDLPALLLQRVGRFVVQECLYSGFLWHFLHSSLFIDHVRDQATGSDLPHISATDIETVMMPLPPLSEQRAIASRLNVLMAGMVSATRECARQEYARKTYEFHL